MASIVPEVIVYDEKTAFTSTTEILLSENNNVVAPPQISPSQEPSPYNVISNIIQFRNASHQFWWDRTGSQFATLLKYAGYTATQQLNELFFYALYIAPELGPAPDSNGEVGRWRSPQTPDGTPLDLSWEWGLDGKGVIRTSFEPIGPLAGTEHDPLNRFATDAWISRLDRQGLVAGLDLEWYKHFTQLVLPQDIGKERTSDKLKWELAPKAGTFVTRDIGSKPIVKLYIFPGLRAQEFNISNLDVVVQAVRALPTAQYEALNIEPLFDYLRYAATKWNMETGIFSIDLVKPDEARIKIYVRAPHTTAEYLMDALTLGGKLDLSKLSAEALADLHDFWKIFIGQEAPDDMTGSKEERAGPGFYYTVTAGKPISPKVYISPISFCKSDAEVLQRLREFFSTRRNADKMLPQMDNYEKALKAIYGEKLLEEHCGSHFYVGCALQKDQLRVVTYLCPQSLEQEKRLVQEKKRQSGKL